MTSSWMTPLHQPADRVAPAGNFSMRRCYGFAPVAQIMGIRNTGLCSAARSCWTPCKARASSSGSAARTSTEPARSSCSSACEAPHEQGRRGLPSASE